MVTAHNAPLAQPAIVCHAGTYGLAGDWGPGSLLANTDHNRQVMHRRYGYGKQAYRIIHNITPPACQ